MTHCLITGSTANSSFLSGYVDWHLQIKHCFWTEHRRNGTINQEYNRNGERSVESCFGLMGKLTAGVGPFSPLQDGNARPFYFPPNLSCKHLLLAALFCPTKWAVFNGKRKADKTRRSRGWTQAGGEGGRNRKILEQWDFPALSLLLNPGEALSIGYCRNPEMSEGHNKDKGSTNDCIGQAQNTHPWENAFYCPQQSQRNLGSN